MVRSPRHGRRAHPALRGFLLAALLASACSAPPGKVAPATSEPLRGVTPAGQVSLPFRFSWNGNSADGVVRVAVQDRAQRPVFAFSARGSSVAAPDGLAEVLTAGEPFSWTVAVLDENNETSRTSAPVEFTPRRRIENSGIQN